MEQKVDCELDWKEIIVENPQIILFIFEDCYLSFLRATLSCNELIRVFAIVTNFSKLQSTTFLIQLWSNFHHHNYSYRLMKEFKITAQVHTIKFVLALVDWSC